MPWVEAGGCLRRVVQGYLNPGNLNRLECSAESLHDTPAVASLTQPTVSFQARSSSPAILQFRASLRCFSQVAFPISTPFAVRFC
ncbi:hypothetical protein IE4872_PC00330 (plasmid) [Rhizobium gallicum]|uniref:Uncharacterized protein n=1 Tax=Rhizobium gallicum TaxID=56730 RepID=A0A1L5NR30_9HYPH|nr:hypothetical protein IE4872_PC00330 [Rhizobium gallicum]